MSDPHETVTRKVHDVFAELAGDRAKHLDGSVVSVAAQKAATAALVEQHGVETAAVPHGLASESASRKRAMSPIAARRPHIKIQMTPATSARAIRMAAIATRRGESWRLVRRGWPVARLSLLSIRRPGTAGFISVVTIAPEEGSLNTTGRIRGIVIPAPQCGHFRFLPAARRHFSRAIHDFLRHRLHRSLTASEGIGSSAMARLQIHHWIGFRGDNATGEPVRESSAVDAGRELPEGQQCCQQEVRCRG